VTDRQTDRPRYSVGKSRPRYVRSTAMRPNNISDDDDDDDDDDDNNKWSK